MPRRSSGITQLYPISFGHAGATLAVFSLFSLVKTQPAIMKMIYSFGVVLGLFIIALSGSKGPLISFSFVFILLFLVYRGAKQVLKNVYLIFGTMVLLAFLIFSDHTNLLSRVWDRINFSDASTVQRIDILYSTLKETIKNPAFGSSFMVYMDNKMYAYPHNLILESFLTTGIVGGVIFLVLNFYAIRNISFLIKSKNFIWLVFLFIQYFIQTFLSLSLYSSSMFWILMSLVAAVSFNLKNQKIINNKA